MAVIAFEELVRGRSGETLLIAIQYHRVGRRDRDDGQRRIHGDIHGTRDRETAGISDRASQCIDTCLRKRRDRVLGSVGAVDAKSGNWNSYARNRRPRIYQSGFSTVVSAEHV